MATVLPHFRQLAGARMRVLGIARRGLDILLPPVCPACRRAIAQAPGLCSRCWSSIEYITEPFCQVYGTPFAYDMGENIVSAQAIAEPPPFDSARSAVRYGPIAQALVHALKYRDRLEVAAPMVTAMQTAGAELLDRCQLIVPVPLHRWRLWSRRYNQSQLLASGLSRRTGIPDDPFVLQRRRRTRQQVGLTARARDSNVRGAFVVPQPHRANLSGRRVLLVDDVYTSGSTVKAASRALLRGGASAVDVLTFANVCR